MPIENDKGPGGVDAAYGKRSTLPVRNYDVTKKYGDTFREDGDGPVNHIIKEDENGNLGIGTSNPLYDVQIGEYGVDTDSTLALATTNTGTGTIRFGDGTSGPNANSGRIQYDHATDNMNFWTNSSERMRITSSGNVGIGLSNPATPLGLADGAQISWGASNYAYVAGSNTANVLTFGTQGTERMRIASSGNVGIGIANPSYRLEVGNSGVIGLNDSTNTNKGTVQMSSGGLELYTGASKYIALGTDSSERIRIDATGNLGLSVTPSNWVGYKAFEFGPGNALWGSNANSSFLSTNLYWDGAFKYKGAFPASYYQQSAGEHRWWSAPLGTADAAANVTQRMTLDVNGNLGIGMAPTSKLDVSGSARANWFGMNTAGAPSGIGTGIAAPASDTFAIYTNTTERMRIDASGNVLVTGSGGLGYGTGSGGTVTQLTSKSTAVTLNKPSGQITMNNAALAAGVAVTFDVNCSAVTATDVPMVVLKGGNASSGTYQVWVDGVFSGQFKVTVRNISGGSLSEALVLNYSLIKGATS